MSGICTLFSSTDRVTYISILLVYSFLFVESVDIFFALVRQGLFFFPLWNISSLMQSLPPAGAMKIIEI